MMEVWKGKVLENKVNIHIFMYAFYELFGNSKDTAKKISFNK